MIDRFGHVATVGRAHLWRGAVPRGRGFETLATLHVSTVFAAGVRGITIPQGNRPLRIVYSPTPLDRTDFALIERSIEAMRSALTRGANLFLCCPDGRRSSSAIVACWRIMVDDWPIEEVEDERRAFGAEFGRREDEARITALVEQADLERARRTHAAAVN